MSESPHSIKHVWVATRRWYMLTSLFGALSWLIGAIGLVLAGDAGSLPRGLIPDDLRSPRPSRGSVSA